MIRYFIPLLAIFLFFTAIPKSEAAPPPEAFGQLPSVHDASISPNGELIALIENSGGKHSVRITNLAGDTQYKDLIQLDHSVRPMWIKWANDDRVLVGVRLTTIIQKVPAPFTYVFTQDIREGKGSILVKSMGIKRQFNANVLNFLMDDPVYILMSVKNKTTQKPEVRKVNVITGKFIKIESSDRDISRWYADLRGQVRIGVGVKYKQRFKDNAETVMRIREAGNDIWHDQSEYPGLTAKTPIFGFSENPNEILIGSYNKMDTLGLYVYDLEAKKITRKLLHNGTYDVSGPVYSGDGKRLIGAHFVGESQEIVFFDKDGVSVDSSYIGEEAYREKFLDQSKDGQKIVYEVTAANDSGYIGLYDVPTNTMTKIADRYPSLSNETLGHVIPVSYAARDGFDIPAYITLPPGLTRQDQVENLPFIVLPHGGPYARQSDYFDYFAQFFAAKGFGVLQMNFRGSTGYGKTFKQSGRENWELMLEDVEDGMRWLLDDGLADPDHLCIAGWSFGGYAALMGAVRNGDDYKCAISIAGVTDINDLVNDAKKYVGGKNMVKNSILSGFDGRKDMRKLSPIDQGDEIKIPVFMAHGTIDHRVHIDQFTRMVKKIKKSSVPYVAKRYENEDHFMSIEKNRVDMFKSLDKFLDDTVGRNEP